MPLIPAECVVSKTWKKHPAAAAWPASVQGTCSLQPSGDKGLWFQGWDPEMLACSWMDDVAFYSLCGIFFSVMGREHLWLLCGSKGDDGCQPCAGVGDASREQEGVSGM